MAVTYVRITVTEVPWVNSCLFEDFNALRGPDSFARVEVDVVGFEATLGSNSEAHINPTLA